MTLNAPEFRKKQQEQHRHNKRGQPGHVAATCQQLVARHVCHPEDDDERRECHHDAEHESNHLLAHHVHHRHNYQNHGIEDRDLEEIVNERQHRLPREVVFVLAGDGHDLPVAGREQHKHNGLRKPSPYVDTLLEKKCPQRPCAGVHDQHEGCPVDTERVVDELRETFDDAHDGPSCRMVYWIY